MGRADALKPNRHKGGHPPLSRAELPVDTVSLARHLIGKMLVREMAEGVASGRIVETEAYVVGDAAGCAYRGLTRRNVRPSSSAGAKGGSHVLSQEEPCRDSTVALSLSSCSLSSGVMVSKSEASKTWRISISYSPPGTGSGQRSTHSIASSFEFTWNIQNPAISSLSSGNGPSMTVRLPAENLTRVPFELGCRPSPASNTPAFVSSSLYFIIAAISSVLGGTPASVFSSALSRIMNRIARSVPDARQSPSTSRRSGRPPCQSAAKRRSWSAASAPAHRRPAR